MPTETGKKGYYPTDGYLEKEELNSLILIKFRKNLSQAKMANEMYISSDGLRNVLKGRTIRLRERSLAYIRLFIKNNIKYV